jgi:hypothetical protein
LRRAEVPDGYSSIWAKRRSKDRDQGRGEPSEEATQQTMRTDPDLFDKCRAKKALRKFRKSATLPITVEALRHESWLDAWLITGLARETQTFNGVATGPLERRDCMQTSHPKAGHRFADKSSALA